MASTDIPPDMLTKWPPTEYYCVRRPLEEWVPPLEVLEEMRRVEPDRFREYGGTHEQLCMSLYQQGKTREEVFREVSSHMSHAEFKGFRKEEMLKTRDRLAIKLGLIPDLKEREENKIQSAGGFNRLRKTSQGTRFDVPPTKWIEEELIVFGAKRPHGKTRVPDLEGEIHVALRQERWPGIAQTRFDALRQSLLFASNLLHVSAAALASFFPDVIEHPQRNVGHKRERRVIAGPVDDDKVFTEETYKAMVIPMSYFASLATSITWVESPEILPQNSWMGVNGSGMTPPEVGDQEWHWKAAKERDDGAGHTTRQITIAIASEFVDAILASKPDSEQHLFATFYAGINIAHELAHFWSLHRYSTVPNPASGETFFGNSLDMELGDAYISWLFGGFIPHPIGVEPRLERFKGGMQWERAHEVGMTDSRYDIRYSMDILHIERMLSHEEWMTQLAGNNPAACRRHILHPQVPFHINETARTVKWRRFELSTREFEFDNRGLAKEGDEGFVDYSLCPLSFCDLDWDDVSRPAAAKLAGTSGQISKPFEGSRNRPIEVFEQRETCSQATSGGTEEDMGYLASKRACEQNTLDQIEEGLQNNERSEVGTSSHSSKRVKRDQHFVNTEDDGPNFCSEISNVVPLPAAAWLFFQHDMPKRQREMLENKLRLFHHEKLVSKDGKDKPQLFLEKNQAATFGFDVDEDKYDIEDPMLAEELNSVDPYGNIERGDLEIWPTQITTRKQLLLCTMGPYVKPKSRKAEPSKASAEGNLGEGIVNAAKVK